MKWSKLPWGWILAMVYVALAPLVFGILAFWPQMPAVLHRLGGQTTAAWVQAIGSVAAIWGAIWIARSSERRRTHEDHQKLCAKLQVLSMLSRRALHAADGLLDAVEARRNKPVSELDLKSCLSSLERFPIDQMPPGRNVLRIITVIGLSEHFLQQYEHWLSRVTDTEDKRPFEARVAAAKDTNFARFLRDDRDALEVRVRQIARDWRLESHGETGLAAWLDNFVNPSAVDTAIEARNVASVSAG